MKLTLPPIAPRTPHLTRQARPGTEQEYLMPARRRTDDDAGFTMIEMVVALVIIGIIMSALTTFFVSTVSATSKQGANQVASQLADDAIERARGMEGTAIIAYRDQTSSTAQWNAVTSSSPVYPYLQDMTEAYDPTAAVGAGATATLPTSPVSVVINDLTYKQNWYVGSCWQPSNGGSCGAAQVSGYITFYRVVVAVVWNDKSCTNSTCTFISTTLINPSTSEPIFNINGTATPPAVVSPGAQIGDAGVLTNLQLSESGGDAPVTWSAAGLPVGLAIGATTGLITGTPTTPGTYSTVVTVTDGLGLTGTASFSWTIYAQPSVTNPGSQTSTTTSTVSLTPTLSGGTPSYTWAYTGLPAGLTYSTSTGKVTGTASAIGSSSVTVTVTDAANQSSSATFSWTVTAPTFPNPGTCSAAMTSGAAGTPWAYWPLSEASGTTAADTGSGFSRNGTYQGGVTYGVAGPCPRDNATAVTLNGSTGYVSNATVMTAPAVFTEAIWFRTTTTSGGVLMGLGGTQVGQSTVLDHQLSMTNAGKIDFYQYTTGAVHITSTSSYNDGNWHLAVGTESSAGMVLYVDGTQVASNPSVTTTYNFNGYWHLGFDAASSGSTSNYFAGSIADAAVYTKAMSSSQVASVYAAGTGSGTSTCASVIASDSPWGYWPLNTTTGSTAADASGNGRNGTYQGSGTFNVAGPCPRDAAATAVTFNGSTGYVSNSTLMTAPAVFTEAVWFRTTSTSGGVLMGMGNVSTTGSTTKDHQLAMNNSGQIDFYQYTTTGAVHVTSTSAYNDGKWHLAVGTESSAGMVLYVDGQQVGTNTSATTTYSYSGYWHLGYGTYDTTQTNTTNNYFAGTLAQAWVSITALTPTQVANLYLAGI